MRTVVMASDLSCMRIPDSPLGLCGFTMSLNNLPNNYPPSSALCRALGVKLTQFKDQDRKTLLGVEPHASEETAQTGTIVCASRRLQGIGARKANAAMLQCILFADRINIG